MGRLARLEGKIDMAARRQMTKVRTRYRKASEADKRRLLDEVVVATTGMGRSTARRMLIGPVPDGNGGVPGPQVVGGQVLLRRPTGPSSGVGRSGGPAFPRVGNAGRKRLTVTASSCPFRRAAAPPSRAGLTGGAPAR